MTDFIIKGVSEFEALQKEVRELQKHLADLTAERDDLLYHVCPALRAEYDEKIGRIERELFAAKLYLREKQRIIEILQARASIHRQMTIEEAKERVNKEFREYEEDLKKKAREEEQFQKEWKKSGWSAHDSRQKEKDRQEEKESEETEKTHGNAEQETGRDSEKGGYSGAGFENGGSRTDTESEGEKSGEGEDSESEDRKDRNPAERLKHLYRRIVKLLHPDVHPNPTQREKELFRMATEAYQNGDLESMEKIWEEIRLSGTDGAAFTDSPEDVTYLRRLAMQLRMRIRELTAEITRLHSSFPYTMKDFLADDKAVEEKQEELRKQIRDIREADKVLQEFIDLLKKKMEEEHL